MRTTNEKKKVKVSPEEQNQSENNKVIKSIHSNYHTPHSVLIENMSVCALFFQHSEDGPAERWRIHQPRQSRQRWSSNGCY